MFDDLDFPDEEFKNWIATLDDSTKSTITSQEALKSYKAHLKDVSKSTSILSQITSAAGKVMKVFAATAVNAFASIVVAKVIHEIYNAYDQWANRVEYAADAMVEAQDANTGVLLHHNSQANQWCHYTYIAINMHLCYTY